ncbi:hypothetical protein D3OALGA1CA_2299 [Olavius algarvensis associated proteobacterium Delta 3]|nr:hypothetical protein D3OALGB2SA_200 [Olavius algarvensis associated proteobacterium Delta 3]CAB5116573.1 hypothetical protein D3OALGA1CA_2299 [Olavius algarvensis associated proteobacterium Delta 3]
MQNIRELSNNKIVQRFYETRRCRSKGFVLGKALFVREGLGWP